MAGGNNVKVSIDGKENVSTAAAKAAAAIDALKDKKITVKVDIDKSKVEEALKDIDKKAKDVGKDAGKFELDTDSAHDKLDSLRKKAKGFGDDSIKIDIDVDSAEDKLDRLNQKASKFSDNATKINLDAGPANSKLDRLLQKKGNFESESTKISLDAGPANSKLDRLGEKQDNIFGTATTIQVDAGPANSKLDRLKEKKNNIFSESVSINIDTDSAREKLKGLADETSNINIDVDVDGIIEDIEDINMALETLKDKSINIDVDSAGALAEIKAIDQALNGIRDENVNVDVDIDDAELSKWKSELDALNNKKTKLKVEVDDSELGLLNQKIRNTQRNMDELYDKKRNFELGGHQSDVDQIYKDLRPLKTRLRELKEDREPLLDPSDIDTLRKLNEHIDYFKNVQKSARGTAFGDSERNIKSAQKALRAFEKELNNKGLTIPASLDVDDKRIKELEDRIKEKQKDIKVKTKLDNSEVEESGLRDKNIKVTVDVKGLSKLASLQTMLDNLSDKDINVNVNTNSKEIGKALGKGKNTQVVDVVTNDPNKKERNRKTITQKVIQKIKTEVDKKSLAASAKRIGELRDVLSKRNQIDADISKAKGKLKDLNDYANSSEFRNINYDRLVDDGKIRQLKKELSGLKVNIDDSKERDDLIRGFKRDKADIESKPIQIRTDVDNAKLKFLNKSLDELGRERKVFLEIDDSDVLRAKKIGKDIDNLTNSKAIGDNVKIQVDADIAAAEAEIAALARDRRATITIDTDRSSLSRAGQLFNSVANSASNIGRRISSSFNDNDRSMRRFARTTSNVVRGVGDTLGAITTPIFKGLGAITNRIPVIGGLMRGIAGIGNPFAQAAAGAATLGVASIAASGVAAAGIYAVYAGLGAVAGIAGIAGAAIGAGFVAGFAAIAAQSEQVKTAYSDLGSYVGDTMKVIAKPVEMPLVRAAEGLRGAFDMMRPSLDRIAQGTGNLIDNLTGKLPAIAQSLGPALEKAFDAGSKHLSQFATKLPGIIDGVGKFMEKLGSEKTLEGAGKFFDKLPGLISGAGSAIEGLSSGFAKMSDYFDSGALDPMINGFKEFANNVSNTDFSGLIGGISDMGNSFGQALGDMNVQATADFLGDIASGTGEIASGTAAVVKGFATANSAVKDFSGSVNEAMDDSNGWVDKHLTPDISESGWGRKLYESLGLETAAMEAGEKANAALARSMQPDYEPGSINKVLPAWAGGDPIPVPVAPTIPPGTEMPLGTDGKPIEFPAKPNFNNIAGNTLPFLGDPIKVPANPDFNNGGPILPFLNPVSLPVHVDPIFPKILPPALGGPIPVDVAPKFQDFNLPFLSPITVDVIPKYNPIAASLDPVTVPASLTFGDIGLPFLSPVEVPAHINYFDTVVPPLGPVEVPARITFGDLNLPFLSPVEVPGTIAPFVLGDKPPPVSVPWSLEGGPTNTPVVPPVSIPSTIEPPLPPVPPVIPPVSIPSVINPPTAPPLPKLGPIDITASINVEKPAIPKLPDTTSQHRVIVTSDPAPAFPNTTSGHHVSVSADSLPSFPNTSSTHTINVVVNGSTTVGGGGGGNINAAPFAGALGMQARGISGVGPAMGAGGMSGGGRGVSQIRAAGESIANSFASGLKDGVVEVDKAAKAIAIAAGAIPDQVDKYLSANSPEYNEAKRIGSDVVNSIGQGIQSAQGQLDSVMQNLNKIIADPMGELDKALSANVPGYDAAKEQVQNFVKGVEDTMSGLSEAAKVGSDGFQKIIEEEFQLPTMDQVIAKAQEIGDGIGAALAGDPSKLAATMDGLGQAMSSKIGTVAARVDGVMGQINQTMRDKVPGFAAAQDKAIEFGNGIAAGVDNARQQINQGLSSMGLPTIPTPQMAMEGINAEVAKAKTAIESGIRGLLVKAPAPVVPAPNLGPVMEALKNIPGVIPTINKVQSDADKAIADINKIPEVINTKNVIKDNVGSVQSAIKDLTKNTSSQHTVRISVQGAGAVTSATQGARSAAMSMARGSMGAMGSTSAMGAGSGSLGSTGTGTVFDIGSAISLSIANGINAGIPAIESAIGNMNDAAFDSLGLDIANMAFENGKATALGYVDGIVSQFGKVSQVGGKLGENVLSSINANGKIRNFAADIKAMNQMLSLIGGPIGQFVTGLIPIPVLGPLLMILGAFLASAAQQAAYNNAAVTKTGITNYYYYHYETTNNSFDGGLVGDPESQARRVLDVLEQSPSTRRIRKVISQ